MAYSERKRLLPAAHQMAPQRLAVVMLIGLMWASASSTAAAPSASAGRSLLLAKDGRTEYRVVVPQDPPPEVKAAADELVLFLGQITGATFPIVGDDAAASEKEILLGNNTHLNELGEYSVAWARLGNELGEEGYGIRTIGDRLVIVGGPMRGTINGVYAFLTDYLGCRWFTPDCSVIPRKPTLRIPMISVERIPPFKIRRVSATWLWRDRDWFVRNHANNYTLDVQAARKPDGTRYVTFEQFRSDPRLANSYSFAGWHWHNLGHNTDLLNPEEYFDEHPEYFSLVNGKRLREQQQPCMTHPEVARIVAGNVKRRLRNDPKANMMDISTGDYGNLCQCPTCKAAYTQYGSSGVYIRFANRIAEEVEKEFPHVTLAALCGYPPLQAPPLGDLKLRHNIITWVGNPSYCKAHDFEECSSNRHRNVLQHMRDWVPRTPGGTYALLYSYGGGPIIRSLSAQFRTFHREGIKGICVWSEGRPYRDHSRNQTPDLRGYLCARLAWDPQFDVKKGIREFCEAYYGAAAPELIRYVREINDLSTYSGKAPNTWKDLSDRPGFHSGGHCDPIKPAKLREFDALFDRAQAKVAGNPDALRRVRADRLPLQYNTLIYAPTEDPLYQKAAEGFFATYEDLNLRAMYKISNIRAGKGQTLEEFRKAILGK